MGEPKIFKVFGYMYHLHRRNFATYLKTKKNPNTDEICENSIHWVGHATTIINLDNTIIVTDPVTSSHLGQINRLINPSKKLESLKINYILISHGHMDHLDRKTMKKLDKSITVICPKQYKKLLNHWGFKNLKLLSPGEEFTTPNNIVFKAYKANHDGKRYGFGKYSTSNSYVIKGQNKSIFFAGDTAFTENFKDIKSDVALMPVGCYKPVEYEDMHCNPNQSYKMFKMMDSKVMIPIHYNTYILAQDEDRDTINTLNAINEGDIKILSIGETFHI